MMFVVIILLAIFAFLTWRNLETGILLLCALLPSYLIRFSIGGVPTTFLEMMTFIVVTIWIFKKIKTASLPSLNHSITLPLCLLLLAATIGIIISPDKLAAIGVWKAFYVEPVLMFFVLVDVQGGYKTRPYEYIRKIFGALGVSALLISLFGLVQYFFSIGIPAPWDLERRITSIFDYPNALALFLEPIIVISWFALANPPSFVKEGASLPSEASAKDGGWSSAFGYRAFWLTVSVLATLNVFLAESEAGIGALIITAICILIFSKVTRRQTFAAILIASALIFTIPTSRTYLVEKLTFQDSSEQVRLSQWKETIILLKDHPIMGVGLSGYPIALKPYHHNLKYEIFQYPHNIVLNIWVELGMLGLVAFFWLAVRMAHIVCVAFAREGRDPPLRSQAILFAAIFLEICIHGLVDVPYFKNDLAMMTWILIACAIAYHKPIKWVPMKGTPTNAT